MLALAVACSSSVSVAFVLFISLFMFQWWFIKELSFVLAAECDMVPAARPPPAWGSASVWTILLHQLCHLLSSCQPTCLLWWFIKGCHSASAAEPRISTKPRPPPAWGSASHRFGAHVFKLIALLSWCTPTSALSGQDLATLSWSVPCPISLTLILLLLPPWLALHLHPYVRSRWRSWYNFAHAGLLHFGLVKVWVYVSMAPVLFFGTGWWFITWYFFLCNYGWEVLDFVSYVPVAIGLCYGVHRSIVSPSLYVASVSVDAAATAFTQASIHLRSPVCRVDLSSSSHPTLLPDGTPTPITRHRYKTFLTWLCELAVIASSIPLWVLFVSYFQMRSYFLALIAIPVFFIITSEPPRIASPNSTPGKSRPSRSNDILAWCICPFFLTGCLLFWIDLLQSLPLPAWLIAPILCLASLVLIGGLSFVLWFWADRALNVILDDRHPQRPARLSLLPDLYEGVWIGPSRRRKRRSSGPGPSPPRIIACEFLPSPGWVFRSMAYLLLLSVLKFALTDLPTRDPATPPSVPAALLEARAALELRATLSQQHGCVPPSWIRRLRPKYGSYSIHYLETKHRANVWIHRLVVRPFHYCKSALPDPPPCQREPTIITPAWPAPSFSHLLGHNFSRPFTLSYEYDLPYDVDHDMEGSSAGTFESIDDASDDYVANLIHFTDDTLSLQDAFYRFSFSYTASEIIKYSTKLPLHWREFHTKQDALRAQILALEEKARPVSWSQIANAFLEPFCPTEAAHVLQAQWMYSFSTEAYVSVDLSRRFVQSYPAYAYNIKMPHVPLIVDTGASVCISPTKSDFVSSTYKDSNMKVTGLSGVNRVAGEGLIRWAVKDTSGETKVIEIFGLHIPTAGVRLLSPQVLRKTHGIGGSIEDDGVLLANQSGNVKFFAKLNDTSNLPILEMTEMPKTSSVWIDTFNDLQTHGTSSSAAIPSAHLNVVDPNNRNLTPGEKELLLWHHRLSHYNLAKVQSLCKDRQWLRLSPTVTHDSVSTPPILPTKHSSTIRTATKDIKCGACCMAKHSKRSSRSQRPSSNDPAMKLKTGHLSPGDCISIDHYVSPVKARRRSGYGKNCTFVGGALYVDHASGRIFHQPQSDLTVEGTLHGKKLLEQEAESVGVSIKSYHSDNGVFCASAFKDHCRSLKQSLSFSGVGAHHQNGVAERCIGTISRMARANLIHLMIHWPARCNLNLWALAMDYAIWIYNRTPRESLGGMSPDEVWSSTRSDHEDLKRAHVFGCPVYVLDPDLQDGKKIPKWNCRSRQGMFVGFSSEHSSLVPLVLNLETGYISPQYHVIFDDSFHTVPSSLTSDSEIDDIFAKLYDNGHGSARERYVDPDEVSEGARSSSRAYQDSEGARSTSASSKRSPTSEGASPSLPILESESDALDEDAASPAIDLHNFDPGPSDDSPELRRSTRNKRKPVRLMAAAAMLLPLGDINYATWGQPALDAVNFHHQRTYHAKAKVTRDSLDTKTYLHASLSPIQSAFFAGFDGSSLSLPWDGDEDNFHPSTFLYNAEVARTNSLISADLSRLSSPGSKLVDYIQPHALAAKRGNDPDNPSYDEAMSGEHQSDYLKAAVLELKTLQDDLRCWELVRRTDEMNVLPSTWAFKCKRYPDGRIKKFKARFCARGDRQVEGVDYFETWSPVVQWSTVRLMLIFSSILDLKSAQADITAAFVHADLPPKEEVYVHQPRGFKVDMGDGHEYVLKLKKSLYGLKQAPRHFFQYLTNHLEKHGVMQSRCDPCLFIGSNIIVIVYVDDILLYARDMSTIDTLIAQLKKGKIWIRKEGSTEGFLGVDISDRKDDGSFTLTQTGLIKRVIEALGLHAEWTGAKETPADVAALPQDKDGTPADPLVNYSSVVGMLLYLSGHSRPDIAFAVHQCARYTFQPTTKHVTALKRIGRYLKGTASKGIIMHPSKDIRVDCYPDADFAGLYNKEDAQDPHSVRSRTGFVICVANCPILWKSKLQTEIALSTMEAEYVALSTACKDLFPLLDLIRELAAACGLTVSQDSNFHVKVHEDNVGALTLGKLEPRRMTPRSKHYAIKYHWFREHIGPRNIKLVKIDTKDQLGDIFTKGLSPIPFKHLRLQLMGW